MSDGPPGSWCALCRQSVEAWEYAPRFAKRPMCPTCGSLPRHRLLAEALQRIEPVVSTATAVMQLGPSPRVTRHLVDLVGHGRYFGLDLGLEDRQVNLLGDLTSLPLRDCSIDVLVIVHVLEHIPNDAAAMAEIARVIGDRGIAVLQVPYRGDRSTDEEPDAPRADRVRRFGQADHVRLYGVDFADRLRAAGLEVTGFVTEREFDSETADSQGLSGQLWFATGLHTGATDWRRQVDALVAHRGALQRLAADIDPVRRLADTEEEIKYLRRRLRSEHGQARRRESEIRAFRKEVAREAKQLATLRRRLDREKQEADAARRQLDAVRRSRSYRYGYTALQPARWIKRAIDNVGRGR